MSPEATSAVGSGAWRRAIAIAVAALVACGPATQRPPAGPAGRTGPPGTPATAGAAAASPSPRPAFPPVRPFSVQRAMRHVRVLAGRIGPRPGSSRAYHRAARYVARTFERQGWRVEVDPFRLPQGGRSANVIATWGRARPRSVIVGAHLDTVPGSPGGNDNASGVAVMLEAARTLSGTRPARRVVLVAFGAEERQPDGSGHLGSDRYASQLAAGRRPRARAMASVDMIGKDARLIVGWLGTGARRMVDAALRSARRAGVPAEERVLGDVSDHVPFARIGVPAALLWTGLEPNYHSPRDVVSNVDPPALRNAGETVIGAARALVGG